MKFCYIDETGLDARDEAVIMAGVVLDAHHLNKSLREWTARLNDVLAAVGQSELKSSKFYSGGDGISRRMSGDDRSVWIGDSLEWLVTRSIKIALSAVDRNADRPALRYEELSSPWLACGFHVALQLQRAYGPLPRNKGTTVIVMDQAKSTGALADLLADPPRWSDTYYSRNPQEEALKEIIHTPFWVRSDHNLLVQLADLVAFVYRRYLEVKRHGQKYPGEEARLDSWITTLQPALLPRRHRWPERSASDCGKAFSEWAPLELRHLPAP